MPTFANVMAGMSPRNIEPQSHVFCHQKDAKEENKSPENKIPRRDTPLPANDSEEFSQDYD